MPEATALAYRLLLIFTVLGVSNNRKKVSASECQLPSSCFTWRTLHACDLGTDIQSVDTGHAIAACTDTSADVTWFRRFRYLPYQFDLIEDPGPDNVTGNVIAVSRCTPRRKGDAADRDEPVAILRSPGIIPRSCLALRVTFWYRLSGGPTFSPTPQEFNLKVLIEDRYYTFPNDLIWGRQNDYTNTTVNEWNFAEVYFGRDNGEQFTVNFLAYHDNRCRENNKTIALDFMTIQAAQRTANCTEVSDITVTTESPNDQTTPTVNSTESYACEVDEPIVVRCVKGAVTVTPPLPVNISDSNAAEIRFQGDNTYSCRTLLRELHLWLVNASNTVERGAKSPTSIICRKGSLEFSEVDPDAAQSTDLVFRTPSVDLTCRKMFVQFLQQLANFTVDEEVTEAGGTITTASAPPERPSCSLPAACYDWITLHQCDMGTTVQLVQSTIITACSNQEHGIMWTRGYKYYPYQFDLVEDGADADKGVFAISRCSQRVAGVAPERNDAVAILRSAIVTPTSPYLCLLVSFYYRLSDFPVFSVNPDEKFHLKAFIEGYGQTFPHEQIWGNETDYSENIIGQWRYVEVVFTRNVGQQFTINFFAYHNDGCQVNLKTIALDAITIRTAKETGICITTTVTTTPSKPTIPTLPTVAWFRDSSQGACDVGPAIVYSCQKGLVSIDSPISDIDSSDAMEAVFRGDNTYPCRTHLRKLHVWLKELVGMSPRSGYTPTVITCRKSHFEFSERDPDEAQSTELMLRTVSIDLKCRNAFVQFVRHVNALTGSRL
ncbi:uncharacterized protein LOC129581901 isoform X2 [Paramacrobiotus metropolitanus]|uniref:uncharacterized protein LOC129581901 isoform X2 n=1 Tax=Paramacrobiotus metropolitanus TaxID=2943436 RepID=UPI0024465B9D|nr:uncharacterized protein LOC129581901 isoform X2 [Paramacrobiotus metropolitanus]